MAHAAHRGDVFTILNPQSPDTDFGTNPILFEATIGGTTRKLLGAGQKSGCSGFSIERMETSCGTER